MFHIIRELLALHSSCKQPISALEETYFYTVTLHIQLNLIHLHLGQALIAASHHPVALTVNHKLQQCLSNIPFTFPASKIYLKPWGHILVPPHLL